MGRAPFTSRSSIRMARFPLGRLGSCLNYGRWRFSMCVLGINASHETIGLILDVASHVQHNTGKVV